MKHTILSILLIFFVSMIVSCAGDEYYNSSNDADGDKDTSTETPEKEVEVEAEAETETEEESSSYPDRNFIHEVRSQSYMAKDESFNQEFTEYFITDDKLADRNVTALSYIGGVIWVGTDQGLYMKTKAMDKFDKIYLSRMATVIPLDGDIELPELDPELEPEVELELDPEIEISVDGDLEEAPELEPEIEVELEIDPELEVDLEPEIDLPEIEEVVEEIEVELDAELEVELEVEAEVETEVIPEVEPDIELEGEMEGDTETPVSPDAIVDIAKVEYNAFISIALVNKVILHSYTDKQSEELPFDIAGKTITSIAATAGKLVIGTTSGAYYYDNGWKLFTGSEGVNIRDIAVKDNSVYAATPTGVTMVDMARASKDFNKTSGDLLDDDARSVVVCGDKVVMATMLGLSVYDTTTSKSTLMEAGKEKLPTDNIISVLCNDTHILMGHAVGATLVTYSLDKIDHYVSKRWIGDNRVPAIAFGEGSDLWFGTKEGVTKVYLKNRTLVDKEKYFDSQVDYFFRLGGFFASDGYGANPWIDLKDMKKHDKDNDGLWTQMMIGGWCFAYASTDDKKYYDLAQKAMENMYLLVDIPAVDFEQTTLGRGFVSRSFVRDDEPENWARHEKEDNWHPVKWTDDHTYLWKDDTSSDEIAGHFFGYPVYYDLCAQDDAEKQKIAKYASDIAKYIIKGEFLLVDLDGEPTLHGHWNPGSISACIDGMTECEKNYPSDVCLDACFSGNYGGGWLNSLEILGTLLSAYHMTGDTTFYDHYEKLITEYRYDEVAMAKEETVTITNPNMANHSDHELAMLAYTTLIRYEPNDDRRAKWIESLEFLYKYERPERNPWWAGVVALSGGELTEEDINNARRTLRELPDDLREWYIDNSHRKDAQSIVNDRHGHPQLDTVFPYDELRTMWWNGNPYATTHGGVGNNWQSPTFWLLPYYLGVYSGIIEQP